MVLSRHFIICDTLLGENYADTKILLVAVRRNALAHDILAETWTILHA
jgi:hypothetical protein